MERYLTCHLPFQLHATFHSSFKTVLLGKISCLSSNIDIQTNVERSANEIARRTNANGNGIWVGKEMTLSTHGYVNCPINIWAHLNQYSMGVSFSTTLLIMPKILRSPSVSLFLNFYIYTLLTLIRLDWTEGYFCIQRTQAPSFCENQTNNLSKVYDVSDATSPPVNTDATVFLNGILSL